MNSISQVMKWIGFLVSAGLLVQLASAAPTRAQIFNPPTWDGSFDFCQTYKAGPLQLERLSDQVSIRFIGKSQQNSNDRHGTYSVVSSGRALVFNGSDCWHNYRETTRFEYNEKWQADNMTPPGKWWNTNMSQFEAGFLIAGLTRFDAERAHYRWEWRSQYFGKKTYHAGERWYAVQSETITASLRKYGFALRVY